MTEANETNANDQSDPTHPIPQQMLVEVSHHSNLERAIHNVMRKNFLEQRPITWRPIKVEFVINSPLTNDFFAVRKKFELAANGNRSEFEERYAFLIDNDQQVAEICRNGYQCTETSFNVLGHSKYGVYVCKYADVCIRRASVRRTWEGNVVIKMIIFKIVEGKQTAALVRKGPKLQPIAPTPQFTSHCSVITPKETDDLEKQFDQSQIFLYEFEGRETLKRPHHCLPYAVVSLIQDGSEWPSNFDELDVGMDLLDTNTLRILAQTDDPLLQNKLRESPQLAEAATVALEHTYQEEPAPIAVSDQQPSPSSRTEINGIQNASDSTPVSIVNGSSVSSAAVSDEHSPKTSSSPTTTTADGLSNNAENSTVPPPPPPPAPSAAAGSTPTSSPTNLPLTTVVTSSTPANSTIGAMPVAAAAYRQPTGVLGAVPGAAAIRAAPGAVYATAAGLTNGLGGQIIYGGIPIDALRGYAAAPGSPYAIAAPAGQGMQQSALFAAQLQALAQQQQQQQQAAQLAAVAAVKQQQQQQSLIGGIPAGYALVRTANGGYALLAQAPQAAAAAMPAQATVQQQLFALNAAGQPGAAAAGRLPVAMLGGQPQQIIYQYPGQPGLQAATAQYIQVPANYGQQPGAVGNTILPASATVAGAQAYANQTPIQYIATSPTSNTPNAHSAATNISSVVSSSSSSTSMQPQAATTLISPQKQSAATATAAALQQQQQYQFAYAQQQQQQSQATTNGTSGTNPYHTSLSQAQTQQQIQAAALAQQQQQQQFGLIPQIQYATQQAVPQQVYYTAAGGQAIYQAGGQSYILAPAAHSTSTATSTGAPLMYSSGPVLHNGAAQQQQQQHASQSQQQQQQQLAYQMLSSTTNHALAGQQASPTAGPGVVAQQPPQLVQRTNVVPQLRHHPYRN